MLFDIWDQLIKDETAFTLLMRTLHLESRVVTYKIELPKATKV